MRKIDSAPVGYATAALSVVVATHARIALNPVMGDRMPLLSYFAAIILVVWCCGIRASLLALALGCLAADYFFIDPRGSLAIHRLESGIGLACFAGVGLSLVLMGRSMRLALARAEASEDAARRALGSERAQRERLHTTLASIADAVITTDEGGRVTALNRAAECLTGWGQSEAAGRRLREVFRNVDGETQKTDDMPVAEVLEGCVVLRSSGHVTLVARDGSTRPVEHSTSPIQGGDGKVTGVVLVFRDVTQRHEAEEALRESERRLTQLADTMPQIVWAAGPDGSVEYINARMYEYAGRPHRDTTADEHWRAAVHPDDLPRVIGLREQAVDEGRVFEAEVRLRGRGGDYRWHLVRSVPVRDDFGRVTRRFGSATDIDSMKRAEAAVRAKEERLRLALAAGRMGTWERTIPTGEIAWSADLEGLYGLPPGSFDGTYQGFERLVHPEDRGAVAGAIARAIEEGSGFQAEFRIVWPDGSVHWRHSKGRVYHDEQGRPTTLLGVGMDITERKRLEEELQLRILQLADADRRKDEFLATLAHELRNPLAPIRNALHLMRHQVGEGGHEAERAMAERQVGHMARLIDDLMDVSRISRGKAELKKEVVDLAAVARHALEAVRPQAESRGHALTARLPAGPVRLEADPARLEQVLTNLLVNAMKYTDPGGQVRLSVGRTGDEAVIRVTDTGIGIEPGMLEKVFGQFVQAERRLDRSQGGLGLGLSLVKSLVEMHGGTVVARSEGPGHGSEFVVRLPAPADPVQEVAPATQAAVTEPTGRPPRRRVLVVDDNVDAADSLGRLLSRLWGQDVRVAYDGPSALEMAAEFLPDLVLLDIGMPGMDGCEVARRLRELPVTAGCWLVAVTGWGQERDRQQVYGAGFDGHMLKPVDPEALRGVVWAASGGKPDRCGCRPALTV